MELKDVVIIGGGSAGMAAAISCFDNGVKDILILEKNSYLGGILNQCIHNGFGLSEFKEELTGPEFLNRFVDQVEERNIDYRLNSYVKEVNKDKIISIYSPTIGYYKIKAKAIIFTLGCYERNAGAIALPGDRPSGIITAGSAQEYLNIYNYLVGKNVFILGSGDIGLIMARRMTLEGANVIGVAEIMPYSNGLNRNIVQCLNDFNIPLYLSTTVTKTIGKSRLEAIEISKVDENLKVIEGTSKIIKCDTLLLSIGLIPNSNLEKDMGIELNFTNGAKVNEFLETNIEGVFTSGNVLHVHDLVDFVVEESRIAGLGAANYIKKIKYNNDLKIDVKVSKDIGYVVPNIINVNPKIDVDLKFRVKRPSKDKKIVIKLNGNEIKKITKNAIIPSEMEKIKINKELLNVPGILEISLEDK